MACTLARAETGATCPFEVVSETREELMEHMMIHARMAHPEMAANPPSPQMMDTLIHQERVRVMPDTLLVVPAAPAGTAESSGNLARSATTRSLSGNTRTGS